MRRLALLLLVLSASACLRAPTQVRLDSPTPILVAYVLDDVFQKESQAAPAALVEAVEARLASRNLVPHTVEPGDFMPRFAVLRDTGRRLSLLESHRRDERAILLVETQARFNSQLGGRYRWNVYVKLTLRSADGRTELSGDLDLAALLSFDHEREAEALAAVKRDVARRTGALLDSYFGGEAIGPSAAGVVSYRDEPGDSIYLVLVDRFFNGDPTNDGDVDGVDPHAWHGGDLAGVTAKLDYLQGLGVQTLWLSPVFAAQDTPFLGYGAFHGYWTEDLTSVEPRFGSEQDLARLISAAHERGMRVLLDLVVNHVGYEAPLYREKPEWFHDSGTITDWDDPEQLLTYQVHGLPDFAQERPEVYAYLRDAAVGWLERVGADGYRLDAVKHVPMAFWKRFNPELRQGRPGLMLLGELYDGGPGEVANVQTRGGFTHMFDFPLAFALRDVFCAQKSPGALGAVLSGDRFYEHPERMVTFLDNHDLPRIRSLCGNDPRRVAYALTAQLAMRGIPALTYGTEAGLAGEREPDNRKDMVFDDLEHAALADQISRLLKLRRTSPALGAGQTRILDFADGILYLARIHADQAALLVVNDANNGVAKFDVPPLLTGGVTIVDALTGEAVPERRVTIAAGGVRLLLITPAEAGEFEGLLAAAVARRRVRFEVGGVELGEGQSLHVVGSGPELGEWSPMAAPRSDADLDLPVGGLWAYKLVVRDPVTGPRWESGENRHIFVRPGDQPEILELTWR